MFATNAIPCRVSLRLGSPTRIRHVWNNRHVSTGSGQAKGSENANQQDPAELERFLKTIGRGNLGFDPWGQPLPLFDLHVPTPLSALPKSPGLQDRWRYMRSGLENKVSNILTMYRIARNHSFPWNPRARAFSPQIFRTSSTKPGTYLEPLRDIAFDSYKQINTAIARNDANTVHTLTIGNFKKRALEQMRSLHRTTSTTSPRSSKKAPPPINYTWRLHSLASPVKCVSIRGQQVNFSTTDPLIGTRWAVQACMRLDTWQSLAIPSRSGLPDPEPKRVLEYLVFEKRMWYDDPWVVRDQLWEGLQDQFRS